MVAKKTHPMSVGYCGDDCCHGDQVETKKMKEQTRNRSYTFTGPPLMSCSYCQDPTSTKLPGLQTGTRAGVRPECPNHESPRGHFKCEPQHCYIAGAVLSTESIDINEMHFHPA